MAIGDILSATLPSQSVSGLNNDGNYLDIEIEGFQTGMNWDLGSGSGEALKDADLSNATVRLTVTSPGFDATGSVTIKVRTLYGTHVARLPSPNQSSEDQATTASGARIRIWLDGSVYLSDSATLDVDAARFVNSSGSSEPSLGVSGLFVTNGSTLPYPKITAKIDRYAGQESGNRVTSNFVIAVNAIAGHGIAAVRVTATGRGSGHVEDVIVTARTPRQRTATGLFAEAYEAPISVSGFQQAELIDCRFRVYPALGDASVIIDTAGSTISTNEVLGRNIVTLLCDRNQLLSIVRVVSPTGSDTTGNGTVAAPYATIGKALSQGANVVELTAGKHRPGNANVRIASNEWAVIRPATGESASTVNIELSSTRTYRHQRLRFQDCTISLADTSSWLDGETVGNHLQFRNCHFASDQNGPVGTPTVGVGYRSDSCSFVNCTGDLGVQNWLLTSFSSSRIAYTFDGCEFVDTATSGAFDAWFHAIACSGVGQNAFVSNATASAANDVPAQDGLIFGWNRMLNFASLGQKMLSLGSVLSQPNHNAAIIGNIFEKMLGISPAFSIAAESTQTIGQATNDVKILHNTVAGERANICYNDAGTTGHARINWFVKANSIHQFNIKADLFGTPNGQRTGGWPVLNGVECRANHWRDGLQFPQEYPGLLTVVGSSAVPANPGYLNDQSGTSGAGFGDYAPDENSPLLGRYDSAEARIGVDLFGSPIRGDVGAVQSLTIVPPPTLNNSLFRQRMCFC